MRILYFEYCMLHISYMSSTLYRKYRPQTFSEVIGQGHIVQTLSNAILHSRIGQAYLFTGPRGTGKTTMARIFAKAVNCEKRKGADPCLKCNNCQNILGGKSFDVFEIDAASNTGVDNIRELRETVKLPPTQGKYKVYIIDEVHMLSSGAFNALLKTLEEPPTHVIFILATTEIHKVPETIISRCQRFDFTRLSLEHIIEKLSAVAKNEKVEIEKNALEMIAISAEGGMRDAESLLAQVISLEDKKITAKEVEEILGTSKWESLFELGTKIIQKDATASINLVNDLSKDGYDLDVFHKSFLNFLRQLLLVSVDKKLAKTFSYELTAEQTGKIIALAETGNQKQVLHIMQCFSQIQGKIKSSFIPQLPLEIAIVKAINPELEQPQITSPNISTPSVQIKTAQKPTINEYPKTHTAQVQIIPEPEPKPIRPITSPVEPVKHTTDHQANIPAEDPAEILEEKLPADSNLRINDIERKWSLFCEDVKTANHSLATVFPVTRPHKIEGNTIILATKYPFHKDKLNEQGNKLTLEASFAKILGSLVRVKTVTMQEAGLSVPNYASPGDPTSQTKSEPKETSSLLTDAMGLMGGQIVE